MDKTKFSEWLRLELGKRTWSQAELARRSGISAAQITRILSGERGIGEEALSAIASALRLPTEEVYRAAGLLPTKAEADEITERAQHIISTYRLPETRQQALDYLEYLRLQEERGEYRAKPAGGPKQAEQG
jgi:transcriptional regulator with XRE-family HTH domain